ncbi:MAG: aminopeptidase P family N-terminal domain-containing protein, partial [Muribaculum sp.]|nr:aminopeptidase P family N-terminal domain-containing protein [Muribaculum sp.]
MSHIIAERLSELQKKMAAQNIDLAIIPHADPHQSEYQATHWHVREFFSGFSGSAGTLVVLRDGRAALWTDSRYFLQAALQLDGTGIELMKEDIPGTPTINEFIISNLSTGQTVGIDGMLFSINAANALQSALTAHGISLNTTFFPAEGLWNDRPALPETPIFIHDTKYAGESASDKISRVLSALPDGASSILISALDAIAWTLNLRGTDVPCNPVFTAFLYLSPTGHTLLIDRKKITGEVESYLRANNVAIQPYDSLMQFIASLPESERVLCDPA